MDIVREAVKFLNPKQVPVVALDQPLFAIAKLVQWNWPEVYGEDKFVVLLGGLHIEMAFLSTIGDLLDGSRWTSILAEAGVTTPGKADALLKSSRVKRARYAHTVTSSHAAHSGHYFTKHLTHTGRKIHSLCHSKIGASGTGNRTPSLITGTLFGRWNSSSWFL